MALGLTKWFLVSFTTERQTPKGCPMCAVPPTPKRPQIPPYSPPCRKAPATLPPSPCHLSFPQLRVPLCKGLGSGGSRSQLGSLSPKETPVAQLQLELSTAGPSGQEIDFTFFLSTRRPDVFNPSPPTAKKNKIIITQDAINQVGPLLMAKARENLSPLSNGFLQCYNYLMKSTYFMAGQGSCSHN